MVEKSAGSRLAAIMWLVAAVLAWAAVGIRYVRREELGWTWAAVGLFSLIMGFTALERLRAAHSTAPRADAWTR